METRTISATRENADLLSAYLHDSTFLPEGWCMDEASSRFSLDVQRIWYERAKPGRALFIVPVIRYPAVASRLTVTDVAEFHTECWPRDEGAGPHGEYLLLSIESGAEDALGLHAEGMVIRLRLRPESSILIQDFPEQTTDAVHTDIGRRMRCPLMAEIDRLRT